jgi:3D (Asp-Asp-Asp) domain-containing protein
VGGGIKVTNYLDRPDRPAGLNESAADLTRRCKFREPMTRPAAIPTGLRRVANVTIVALCTASSLALLGAVPAEWARSRMSEAAAVARPNRPAPTPVDVSVSDSDALFAAYADEPRVEVVAADDLLVSDDALDVVPPPALATPARATRVMRMEVTAYCPCTRCCGSNAQGITASGKLVDYNGGKFVAADTRVLPFGKKLVIPGYADGAPVEVIDRGGAIKGNKLDLYFPTHAEALVWGRQQLDVIVYE